MADVLGKKISELAETTDLAGLYTIGSDRNNQSKKVPLQFVKEAADYANAQGDYAKGVGDTIQGNTGVNEYPAFSSSTQYAAGSVVRYNNKLYRFTALHPAGAWVGTDAIETSIKAETDVKLTELESEVDAINAKLGNVLSVSIPYIVGSNINKSIDFFAKNFTDKTIYIKANDTNSIVGHLSVYQTTERGYTLLGIISVNNTEQSFVVASDITSDSLIFQNTDKDWEVNGTIEVSVRYNVDEAITDLETSVQTLETSVQTLETSVQTLETSVQTLEQYSNDVLEIEQQKILVPLFQTIEGQYFEKWGNIKENDAWATYLYKVSQGVEYTIKWYSTVTINNLWFSPNADMSGKILIKEYGNVQAEDLFTPSEDGYVILCTQMSYMSRNTEPVAYYKRKAKVKGLEELETAVNNVLSDFDVDFTQLDKYRIIHIGKDYEYKHPQEAIYNITDASEQNQYLLMLHDDIIVTQYSELYVLNSIVHPTTPSHTSALLWTKDYVHLMGATRKINIKCLLPMVTGTDAQNAYCNCLFIKGNVKIANLSITSQYSRYTMHLENGSNSMDGDSANRYILFKNVDFNYLAGEKFNHAVGIGTAPGQFVKFDGCKFFSKVNDSVNTIHSHPNYALPFTYYFKNCIFNSSKGYDGQGYSNIRSGVRPSFIYEGCSIGSLCYYDSPNDLTAPSISSPSHDWRNGYFNLHGHDNSGYMGKVTPRVLCLTSDNNNVDVDVIISESDTDAGKMIFGEPLVKYLGAENACGKYIGTELVIKWSNTDVMSVAMRLGDCSVTNKILKVIIGGQTQSIALDKNYPSMSDTAIIAELNAAINGASISYNPIWKILHFDDNVVTMKNSSNNAIEVGDIVALDYTNVGCVRLSEIGDRLYGVASERINPQEYGNVIIKSRQNFRGIGGLSADIASGRYYKAGGNGKLIETESSDAVFVCIGNGILCFL